MWLCCQLSLSILVLSKFARRDVMRSPKSGSSAMVCHFLREEEARQRGREKPPPPRRALALSKIPAARRSGIWQCGPCLMSTLALYR